MGKNWRQGWGGGEGHRNSGTSCHLELQEIRMLCLFHSPMSGLFAALFGVIAG